MVGQLANMDLAQLFKLNNRVLAISLIVLLPKIGILRDELGQWGARQLCIAFCLQLRFHFSETKFEYLRLRFTGSLRCNEEAITNVEAGVNANPAESYIFRLRFIRNAELACLT